MPFTHFSLKALLDFFPLLGVEEGGLMSGHGLTWHWGCKHELPQSLVSHHSLPECRWHILFHLYRFGAHMHLELLLCCLKISNGRLVVFLDAFLCMERCFFTAQACPFHLVASHLPLIFRNVSSLPKSVLLPKCHL